ncbi:MAG TPA: HDOD domain-containing protein [Terracidiphilus sp.]|nr:HDOD domain-containing protein [Terracidiphilus sp.]
MALLSFDSDDTRPARFAARMPILSRDETVFGYKLLFRTDFNNYFPSVEGDVASRGVIDMSSLIGLDTLSNNLPAFIVTTRDTLVGEYLSLLPPDKVIAEIPDSVSADSETVQSCKRLKGAGYRIALGNYRAQDPRKELEGSADYLKVDIQMSSLADVSRLAGQYRGGGPRLIAEKIETREDFEFTKSEGFSFFEGYFFRKPEMMRARGVQSNRTVYLRLLGAVSKPVLDWKELEEIVKSDPMLYFRLLRYLNSAIFGLRCEVKTVGQALTILGDNEIRRWCRLSGMLELSKNKPSDLALAALVRARFAELIGARVDRGDSDLFQVGLLSLMDAILEIPMREVLDGLPLDEGARTVLLDNAGPLSTVYELILAVEAGVWRKVAALSYQLGLDLDFIARSQWDAMEWAQSIVTAV